MQLIPPQETRFPHPEVTGRHPDPEIVVATMAANIAYGSWYAYHHPHAPWWEVGAVVLGAFVFPLGFLLLLRRHAANRAMRTVWLDIEPCLSEAVGMTVCRCIEVRQKDEASFSRLAVDYVWDEMRAGIVEELDQYRVEVRGRLVADLGRLDVADVVYQQVIEQPDKGNCSESGDQIFCDLHRRYIRRNRPDMLLYLLGLCGGNVAWMGCWW